MRRVALAAILLGCVVGHLDVRAQQVGILSVGRLDPPTLAVVGSTQTTIDIRVCGATTTGASAGFSVQRKTAADYAVNGWSSDVGDSYGAASFSGVPSSSRYNLAPGECVDVTEGNFVQDI